MSSLENAWCRAVNHVGLSAAAVAMMQSLGCAPAGAICAASEYAGPGRKFHWSGPSGRKPMLVAMIVGCSAVTRRFCPTASQTGVPQLSPQLSPRPLAGCSDTLLVRTALVVAAPVRMAAPEWVDEPAPGAATARTAVVTTSGSRSATLLIMSSSEHRHPAGARRPMFCYAPRVDMLQRFGWRSVLSMRSMPPQTHSPRHSAHRAARDVRAHRSWSPGYS